MDKLHFAPGPSHLYPGVIEWSHEALTTGVASISHRSKQYSEIHNFAVDQLRELLDTPADYQVFFVASATEAMERTIQNCVKSQSYHLVNGSFSKRFAAIAGALGKKVQKFEKEPGQSFDPHELKVPAKAELVCFTHNETSTGAMTPLETIYEAKKQRPDVLVAVDVVSSVPVTDLDLTKVDVAFFSVQKGFGLPAGLGVMVVSPAARQKAKALEAQGIVTGTYHSFREMSIFAEKSQTPETPNVLGIYLLGKVAADMNRRGIETLHAETDAKLALLHEIAEVHPELKHFVAEPRHRSRTVMTLQTGRGSSYYLERLESEGIVVGSGYGSDFKEKHLRIANFPALSVEDVRVLTELLRYI